MIDGAETKRRSARCLLRGALDRQEIAAGSLRHSVITPAGFAEGTRITTDRGPVAIERLRIGDKARTAWGELRPIEWIGRRQTDCGRHPAPRDIWPVRVAAHAFGHGRPWRDVFLSPDHAIHVADLDGPDRLIPVRYLINDATIAQTPVDRVTYWHIELPEHDIVMAEGLASGSYLDTGNRAAFETDGDAMMLHHDFSRADFSRVDFSRGVWAERACADLVLDGPAVALTRDRLLARASDLGFASTRDPGVRIVAEGRDLPSYDGGMVLLPPGSAPVRICSRTMVPAHRRVTDPDHRRLGVAVASLTLDGVTVLLDDPRLGAGWHAPEPGWRWTDGSAELATGTALCLTVRTLDFADYWVEQPADGRRVSSR